ncbi:hypothetical protein AWZ03_006563 [Drosophila navojoa]|uniref:DRBM domain-containing protein n=2 Tax=Drosophila navojoa TaxID=7232 RepID=A0A484BFB7_DRONA|nr:hypothetical protein AWZ03_006563 [Drosophila navojoa]
MDVEAFGNGRSKRDAKHLAAANIMRKLRKIPGLSHLGTDGTDNGEDNLNISSVADELTNMNRDMLKELRDYCVRHDMPLPVIEIVQQSGSPNAPEFVACCSVASIKRYGKSDKKKDARQRAAIEMLCVISNDLDEVTSDNQVVSTKKPNITDLDSSQEDAENERRRKFKTYRELTDAGGDENFSVKLCDRHNYFKSYYPHLKEAAFKEINSDSYISSKDKLMAVLEALKLKPRITTLQAKSWEPLLQIELNCEYDCVFVGLESKIYEEFIEYFRIMLV